LAGPSGLRWQTQPKDGDTMTKDETREVLGFALDFAGLPALEPGAGRLLRHAGRHPRRCGLLRGAARTSSGYGVAGVSSPNMAPSGSDR